MILYNWGCNRSSREEISWAKILQYESLNCLRLRSDYFLIWDWIRPLWQFYSARLPGEHICMADTAYLNVVWQQIQVNWKTADDVLLCLSKFGSDLFCTVSTLCKIWKALPVSTATYERAFSRLRTSSNNEILTIFRTYCGTTIPRDLIRLKYKQSVVITEVICINNDIYKLEWTMDHFWWPIVSVYYNQLTHWRLFHRMIHWFIEPSSDL